MNLILISKSSTHILKGVGGTATLVKLVYPEPRPAKDQSGIAGVMNEAAENGSRY
jgi:hypothetical protein